jgi:CheY-like chemotaxis protein
MDGIEFVKHIDRTKRASVAVICSSVDWSHIENDAKIAGVEKFLPKPLFKSAIVDLINSCLGPDQDELDEPLDNMSDDFTGHTILLAEDVEVNREIIAALLEPVNLNLDFAVTGVQAVEAFKNNPNKYDMIFMDVQMPEMDGYEATKKIRELPIERAKDIPIVAMTANVFREDIAACIKAGMNNHLGKPIDINEVLEILRTYIGKKEIKRYEKSSNNKR